MAEKPYPKRYKIKGKDKTKANASCQVACNTCSCVNSDVWRYEKNNGKLEDYNWVQKKPARCRKMGVDHTKAREICRLACGTCISDGTPTLSPTNPPTHWLSVSLTHSPTASPTHSPTASPTSPPTQRKNMKRGIASNSAQNYNVLDNHSKVSWWYSWGTQSGFSKECCDDSDAADTNARDNLGLEFIPMFWRSIPSRPFGKYQTNYLFF